MGKTKTFDNLKRIILKSYDWRNKNLSDSNVQIKFTFFTRFNFLVLLLSIFASVYICHISDDLVNAILTFTAIFATLIIPVLILVYDKFSKDPNGHLSDLQKESDAAKKRYTLHKNFTNRYIFVTLENIIISILIIVFIIVYKSTLQNYLKIDFSDYAFDTSAAVKNISTFLHLFLALLLKCTFSVLLVKFIYFLFFSIGAIGDFFISVLKEEE